MASKQGDVGKAVALVRVSTDRQDNGPEVQRAAISAWAAQNGVTVVSWHEEHESGCNELADRPGLLDALQAVTALGAGVLVVQKRDRLARNVEVAAAVERLAKSAGAVLHCANGEGNGSDPGAQFSRRLFDAFAEYEAAQISLRTRLALAQKKHRSELTGNAPLGKRADADGKLHDDPTEAAAIAKAKTLRQRGLSLSETARQLTSLGFRSRAGTPYCAKQVQRMCA